MRMPHRGKRSPGPRINITFLLGLFSILVGAYNLFLSNGKLPIDFEIPQIVSNILLMLAGFFLWIMSYRLSRYKYHASHIF